MKIKCLLISLISFICLHVKGQVVDTLHSKVVTKIRSKLHHQFSICGGINTGNIAEFNRSKIGLGYKCYLPRIKGKSIQYLLAAEYLNSFRLNDSIAPYSLNSKFVIPVMAGVYLTENYTATKELSYVMFEGGFAISNAFELGQGFAFNIEKGARFGPLGMSIRFLGIAGLNKTNPFLGDIGIKLSLHL
jgi:hypothetical protein